MDLSGDRCHYARGVELREVVLWSSWHHMSCSCGSLAHTQLCRHVAISLCHLSTDMVKIEVPLLNISRIFAVMLSL